MALALTSSLAWALLDFVWQGALVGYAAAVALGRPLPRADAVFRLRSVSAASRLSSVAGQSSRGRATMPTLRHRPFSVGARH